MLRPTEFTMHSLHFDGSALTPEEWEFALAMHAYQRRFRRRYPTWREVLHVARSLGYRKRESTKLEARNPNAAPLRATG